MAKKMEPVTLKDVTIVYRNFEGRAGDYNREGEMGFSVVLPEDVADAMSADGWNVRCRVKDVDGTEDKLCTLPVKVSYDNKPPRIVMVTSQGRQTLEQRDLKLLDWVDIKCVDLTLNPYEWEVNGNSGVKAYARSVFITIQEDELDLKYASVPEVNLHPETRAEREPDQEPPAWEND